MGTASLVHCAAGVHRAPIGCAMILAVLKGEPFANMVEHIQRVRNIEPWIGATLTSKLGCMPRLVETLFLLLRSECLPVGSQQLRLRRPFGIWCLLACQRRILIQCANGGRRSHHFAKALSDSVHEALTHERPFCRACYNFMPAHVLGELAQNRVYWKNG